MKKQESKKIQKQIFEKTGIISCILVDEGYTIMIGSGWSEYVGEDKSSLLTSTIEGLQLKHTNLTDSFCADAVSPSTEFVLDHKGNIQDENFETPPFTALQYEYGKK